MLGFVYEVTFTNIADAVLSPDDYVRMEDELLENPRRGEVIPGGGGVRKLRVAIQGRGKRGGGRAVYLYIEVRQRIHLLAFYAKNERADLSRDELKVIRALATQLKGE